MNKTINKKVMLIFCTIFFVGVVSAAWFLTIDANVSATVFSNPEYADLSISVPDLNVNTTMGNDTVTVYSDHFQINSDITINTTIYESFQDLSNGTCSGGQSDCYLTYGIYSSTEDYSELVSGQLLNITASDVQRNISVTMFCEAYSCPQSRDINISINQE